ncbi:O-antigen ligase domain-containing protein [Pseudomonas putida]|uniref:O-antigen ligase family protein n=1 Tax=Pseudomonas putida TaxID=303 RepID=UPI0010593651|nr:O-antigen ligase family protein [Pseudomonas putida]TDJ74425.1 O-antigen ligase domain-containing protein [Pseudomonas putida]
MSDLVSNRMFSRSGRDWIGLLFLIMAIGVFIQITGKVWITSGSARNSQVYIWLLLPGLVLFIYNLFKFRFFIFSGKVYLPWGLFLLWGGLSTVWASGGDTGAMSLAKRGLFIALYLVSIWGLIEYRPKYLRFALLSSVAIIAFSALISLVYQYGVVGHSLAYRAYRIHALGFGGLADFGWPVAAGIFHGAVACWALSFALERSTTSLKFVLWMACFFVLSLYVLLTYTRGAWFGLAAASLLVVALNNSLRAWAVLVSGLLCVMLAGYLWWDKILFEIAYRKLSGREPIWDYFFTTMHGHWTIGHGLGTPFEYKWPGQETISPHAHSLYLQQIYDSGLVSLVLMGVGLGIALYNAYCLRQNYWIRIAVPALSFALIAMLTDVERIYTRPGDYWTVFWLPLAIILAVSHRRYEGGTKY